MIKEAGKDDKDAELDFEQFVSLMTKTMKNSGESTEEELVEVFQTFDKDGDNKIDHEDLFTTLKELGEQVTEDDVDEMLNEHDLDADGFLNFEEFVRMMAH